MFSCFSSVLQAFKSADRVERPYARKPRRREATSSSYLKDCSVVVESELYWTLDNENNHDQRNDIGVGH